MNHSTQDLTSINKEIPVIVTGANGYLASHIIKLLLESGYKVKGTIRDLKNIEKHQYLHTICPQAKENLELVEADLSDDTVWDKIVKGAEVVLHVASPLRHHGLSDEEMLKITTTAMKAITSTCLKHGVKRLIYTSSTATQVDIVPGEIGVKVTEETWGNPETMDGYGRSKYYAEKVLMDFHKEHPNEIISTIVLPSLVFGPAYDKNNLSSMNFVKDIMNGLMPGYPEKESLWPLVDSRDVAFVHLKAMESKNANGKRFMAFGENTSTKRVLEVLDNSFGKLGFMVNNKQVSLDELKKSEVAASKFSVKCLGKGANYDTSMTREVLNHKFIPIEESLQVGGNDLIKLGVFENKEK